jgi:hypothetical protein
LSVVANKYLTGEFVIDLVAFLPFGYASVVIDSRLDFLWILKSLRIKNIALYLSDSRIS